MRVALAQRQLREVNDLLFLLATGFRFLLQVVTL